jgi:ribosome-associated translation inhibitor RaiA
VKVVPKVSFEGLEHSDALAARIVEEATKLCAHHKRISALRIVVARPQHRHHKGDAYQVRIHATVPDAPDVIVTREPSGSDAHDDAYAAVSDAFTIANEELHDSFGKRNVSC